MQLPISVTFDLSLPSALSRAQRALLLGLVGLGLVAGVWIVALILLP